MLHQIMEKKANKLWNMDLEWSYAILGTLDPQNLVQVNALSINYQDFSWQLAFVSKVKYKN